MVNDVVSSQVLDLRAAQTSRPAVKPTAINAQAQASAASSGIELPRAPAPEPVDLSRVSEGLNRYLTSSQRNLNFRVDESSGRTIITVVNPETNEVVRQIPPEELLALARTMREAGLLFDALA
jgi:flagellar protein FlaG